MDLYWKLKLKNITYKNQDLVNKLQKFVNERIHAYKVSFYKDKVYIYKPDDLKYTKDLFVFHPVFDCQWENCGLYLEVNNDSNIDIIKQMVPSGTINFRKSGANYNFYRRFNEVYPEIDCNILPNIEESSHNSRKNEFDLDSYNGEDIVPRWNKYIKEGNEYYINIYIDQINFDEGSFINSKNYINPVSTISYSLCFDDERDICVNSNVSFNNSNDNTYQFNSRKYVGSSQYNNEKSSITMDQKDKANLIKQLDYMKQNNINRIKL